MDILILLILAIIFWILQHFAEKKSEANREKEAQLRKKACETFQKEFIKKQFNSLWDWDAEMISDKYIRFTDINSLLENLINEDFDLYKWSYDGIIYRITPLISDVPLISSEDIFFAKVFGEGLFLGFEVKKYNTSIQINTIEEFHERIRYSKDRIEVKKLKSFEDLNSAVTYVENLSEIKI